MERDRFDHFTRRVADRGRSRRGLLSLGIASGLGLLGVSQLSDQAAAACRKDGKTCGPSGDGSCCSGTCKRGKCRPTPGAKGCTVRTDTCRTSPPVPCPENPAGVCVVLDNGKPYCIEDGGCERCRTDRDCDALPRGKCIRKCKGCALTNGQFCGFPRRP